MKNSNNNNFSANQSESHVNDIVPVAPGGEWVVMSPPCDQNIEMLLARYFEHFFVLKKYFFSPDRRQDRADHEEAVVHVPDCLIHRISIQWRSALDKTDCPVTDATTAAEYMMQQKHPILMMVTVLQEDFHQLTQPVPQGLEVVRFQVLF